ncbi:MAG: hypothetical protein ABR582_12605 [Gemmatimonadaceae bacterium]
MRLFPGLHEMNRDVKAARVALAAGAVAGLVVLGACADNGGKTITAPTSIRNATVSSGGFGQAKTLTLCISANSPTGSYTFVNAALNRNFATDGFNNALSGNGFWDGTSWNDPGDGGDGTTVANAEEGVPYSISHTEGTATDCVLVLNRTIGDAAFMAKLPIAQGGTCDPNLTACGGENDSFAAANISYQSNTVGAIYDHTDCTLDNGVLMPEHVNPTTGNPPVAIVPWPSGGYDGSAPFITYGCGTSNIITRGFVNFEHGATITYAFTAAPPTTQNNCTFTQGYYKNHETYTQGVLAGNVGTTYIDASGHLLIGSYALTAAQIDAILGTAVGKGYSDGGVTFTKDQLGMIHQLITAELNIAGGASSSTIAATITAANAGYTTASKSQLSAWTNTLDNFNSGLSGPNHCS